MDRRSFLKAAAAVAVSSPGVGPLGKSRGSLVNDLHSHDWYRHYRSMFADALKSGTS
jgi:TAT (twin-arginine translocation) pathway signal sequence